MGSAETDREVLLHFFRTTGGESWTRRDGWEENAIDIDSWYGVTTNTEGRVVKLDLSEGGNTRLNFLGVDVTSMVRQIPLITEIMDQLPAFKSLRMEGNGLSGPIPKELGRLDALKELELGGNNLSGAIPPELGQLGNLEQLGLESNKLSGRIPKELGGLGAIKELRLGLNKLSGTIAPELGYLGALLNTVVDFNELSCESQRVTIPKELGRLGALKNLDLSYNRLSGKIPPELGQLGALEVLRLFGNKLSGAMPKELGELAALKELNLGSNKLSGAIPPELSQLEALEKMVLELNNLSGCIPKEFGRLRALTLLDLGSNKLYGTVPHELGRLGTLKELRLMDNELTDLGSVEDALRMVTPVQCSKVHVAGFNYLKGNPWVMPPESVVNKGVLAVNKYLLALRAAERAGAEVKALKLLKVVLIGSAHAGKTSLVRSIVEGRGCATVGTSAEASTVGIDLIRHQLNDATIEFFDCAGQVDYYGMHQTFLTTRALYLLVWDVSKCRGKAGEELDEVVFRDIMRWLFALHLRAPGCSVILVANKCDGSIEDFRATIVAVEECVTERLQEWKEQRQEWNERQGGGPGDAPRKDIFGNFVGRGGFENPFVGSHIFTSHNSEVSLSQTPSLVSCYDGGGLPEVIRRVADHGATAISVPPAWALALEFLGALRDKRSPLRAVRGYLGLDASSEELPEGASDASFTTEESLFERWKSIVLSVEGELQSAAAKMAVSDPGGALEGALWISEFAGHIVRFANGDGIFLNAGWVSFALKPVLDHKIRARTVPQHFASMRDELVNNGILRRGFAEHLWSKARRGPLSDGQMDALYRVVISIGIGIPLETADSSACPSGSGDRGRRDMLVIMRLPEMCGRQQQDDIDRWVSEAKQRHGVREVTLKWRFDSAGSPPGLVERVIASCHVVGVVEMGLCWRYGAIFKSRALAPGGVGERLYTFFIRYDDTCGADKRVLEMSMFGPLDGELWTALRWIASSMVNLSREWPGVLWEGWLECAKHPMERTYLATPAQARIGSPLFPHTAQRATRNFCDCDLVAGGVLRLVRENLGDVIDTHAGGLYATKVNDITSSEEEASRAEAAPSSATEGAPAADENESEEEEKTSGPQESTTESGDVTLEEETRESRGRGSPSETAVAAGEEEKIDSETRTPESGEAAPEPEEKTPSEEETPESRGRGSPSETVVAAGEEEKIDSETSTLGSGEAAPEPEEKTPSDASEASEEAPAAEEKREAEQKENTPPSTGTPEHGTTLRGSSRSTPKPEKPAPEEDEDHQPCCTCCSHSFTLWEPSATKTAGSLFSSGLATLIAGLSLVGSESTGWIVCFGLTGVFWLAAAVAAVFAVRYKMRMAREENATLGTRPSGELNA